MGTQYLHLQLIDANREGHPGIFFDLEIPFAGERYLSFITFENGGEPERGSRIQPDPAAIRQYDLLLSAFGRSDRIV